MILFLSIVAFIVIFSLLILVHEFGHFFVAKKAGIKVEEFGFGLPPRIYGFKPKNSETVYSLNAIPFGGFVKLYGEDSSNKKVLASKRSFAAKSPRVQIAVVVAGVLMNFLLAFLLLMIGFIAGMQPLFVSQEDVLKGIDSGIIEINSQMQIKDVRADVKDIFWPGDKIITVNGKQILNGNEISGLEDGKQVVFNFLRENQDFSWQGNWQKNNPPFKVFDVIFLPRVVLKTLDSNSVFYKSGLREGDIIVSINNQQIYSEDNFDTILKEKDSLKIEILRQQIKLNVDVQFAESPKVIITEISFDSPADKAGLLSGDSVLAINDYKLNNLADITVAMKNKKNDQIKYTIDRDGEIMEFFMKTDVKGLVGVVLSPLIVSKEGGLAFYIRNIPTSILKIHDVRYSLWEAPVKALEESARLSVLTIKMFVNVISSFVSHLAVPDGVSGPVGIAQMTYTFVQEGVVSLVRFTALLSLSLAIINILPFPALDGGRFFIILFTLIVGKKMNPKFETWLHVIGFLILMGMIALITFNDIVRIFTG